MVKVIEPDPTTDTGRLHLEVRGLREDLAGIFHPRLRHSSWHSFEPDPHVVDRDPDDAGVWITHLVNAGIGPLDLLAVSYTARFRDTARAGVAGLRFPELVALLRSADDQYLITNFSTGTCIRPGDWQLAQLTMPFGRQFLELSVSFTVASATGAEDTRVCHLVPPLDPPNPDRPGLPHPVRRPTDTT